jgi:hypothetical protein
MIFSKYSHKYIEVSLSHMKLLIVPQSEHTQIAQKNTHRMLKLQARVNEFYLHTKLPRNIPILSPGLYFGRANTGHDPRILFF